MTTYQRETDRPSGLLPAEAPRGLAAKEDLQDGDSANLAAQPIGANVQGDMSGIPPKMLEHLQEKFFAQTLLTVGAGKSSAALDSFAGWLLAGFGAALTFLLGNLDSLGQYLPIGALRDASYIFIGALIPAALGKVISVVVVGTAEASALGREIGKATSDQDIKLDLPVALRECERAFFPPMNRLLKRSLKKMEQGDLTASARGLIKWTQIQAILLLLEVGLIGWAAAILVRGLTI